jgi:hypothetical protein
MGQRKRILALSNPYRRLNRNGKTVYLHRHVWEQAYGDIPNGWHIHHKDGNRENNSLANLELVSRQRHFGLHDEREPKLCKRCGIRFHARKRQMFCTQLCGKLYRDHIRSQARRAVLKKCKRCGKSFSGLRWDAVFCSSKCQRNRKHTH